MKSWRAGSLGLSALVLALLVSGCDEKPAAEGSRPKAVPTAAPTQEPALAQAPEPKADPAPPRARKKLEDCDKGTKVAVGNPDLEAAIRVKAQKPEGELTTADLRKLRSLNLSRIPLEALDVCLFRHMTELREFFVAPGQLDDLSPIMASTKLESLGFSGNPITDLAPLAKMTHMDRLDLAHTKIKDLAPLSEMKLMTELNIDDTLVTDLAPLAALIKLERLSVKKTKIKDVKALAEHKELKFLYVGESPLADDSSTTGALRAGGTKILDE